jgi:hypothetical protein
MYRCFPDIDPSGTRLALLNLHLDGNRIAVRFVYEWRDDSGNWFHSWGNENWRFDKNGLMCLRFACINDHPSKNHTVSIICPLGRRPDGHPGLSDLGDRFTMCCNGARQASFLSLLSCYRVSRTYLLYSVTSTKSCIDDILFHGKLASITDAGVPGLMLLNLENGCQSSSIQHRRATDASQRQDHARGGWQDVRVHADQLERTIARQGHTNCSVRSCNHTFVTDSFDLKEARI